MKKTSPAERVNMDTNHLNLRKQLSPKISKSYKVARSENFSFTICTKLRDCFDSISQAKPSQEQVEHA